MTATQRRQSVLLIGRSRRVLDESVAELRELGYDAQGTNDFSPVTGRFDVARLDLVVLGGQVPPERRAELREEIGAINPRAIVLQGLAGIPGLLVAQVHGAFRAGHLVAGHAPAFAPADRSIRLRLPREAAVRVIAWWQASFVPPDPGSDSLVLLDGRLAAGAHAIPVPDRVPRTEAFATVQVDAAVHAFGIAGRR